MSLSVPSFAPPANCRQTNLTFCGGGDDNGAMNKRYESRFVNQQGHEIFYQSWINPAFNKTMVVTHGLAEHSDCYHEFATRMNEDQFNVIAWDLPGHGRSYGKRGYVESFDHYLNDFRQLLQLVNSETHKSSHSLVLFGHSMGGLITLLYALQNNIENVSALVLSSPALGFHIEVSAFKDWLARTSNKFFPSLTLYNEIKYTDLTHDPEKIEEYNRDSLRHDKICSTIYLGMLEGFDFVKANASQINKPVLFQLAGQDHIVSTPRSKEVFELIPSENKLLEIYADSYHEIFNDHEKDQCFKDLKNFLRTVK